VRAPAIEGGGGGLSTAVRGHGGHDPSTADSSGHGGHKGASAGAAAAHGRKPLLREPRPPAAAAPAARAPTIMGAASSPSRRCGSARFARRRGSSPSNQRREAPRAEAGGGGPGERGPSGGHGLRVAAGCEWRKRKSNHRFAIGRASPVAAQGDRRPSELGGRLGSSAPSAPWAKRKGRVGLRTQVKGGGLVKEVDGGAPAVKKKEDGEGVREVICYAVWA
jgi:hypothetical protein